ncbi:hypothetical protein ATL39_3053 [Sinobaca qinghaiensis]|uniref:Uncharacterized protein n=1 Tax=Sinobaca qinghaiensis TaxID=342944 RepID=A0A419UWX5_9BACL|nr:hypothetical protein [Sinobaca qinghaiensis]RKD69629.1 hypothetical protein ATL39_3053 [Sinobaca qinghaiensis]
MAAKYKSALFLENGKTKCWVIVMRYKRSIVSKKENDEEKKESSSECSACKKTSGKIMFAIQDALETHYPYELIIEEIRYTVVLHKISKKETDNQAFFIAKGHLSEAKTLTPYKVL